MSILAIIGRACFRRRLLTLLAWTAGLAVLVTLWQLYGAAADNSFSSSDPGQTLLDQHFSRQSGDSFTLAVKSTAPLADPAVRPRVAAALTPFRTAPHVSGVSDPYAHVSRDGHIAFATVQFNVPTGVIPAGEVRDLMNDATSASGHGVTFSLGGDIVDTIEAPSGGSSDGFGVGAAMLVLLIAFGSLLAMGLPIVTALFGIGTGVSLLELLGHAFPAPSYSVIIASGIGLGVGVDYALFMVTRFRDELRSGADPETATVNTMRSAGRSVLTAGTTVVIGMLGLLVLRESLMNGVSVAAAATVAMTVLASLTLLPALLGFSGTRLVKPSRLRLRRHRRAEVSAAAERSPWAERWAGVVRRHPVIAAVSSLVVVLLLAAPALSMTLSMPDDSTQPRGSMGYTAYATLSQGFGPGFDAPLIVAAALPSPSVGRTVAARIAGALRAVPGVAQVAPPTISSDGKAAMIIAYPATQLQSPQTNALVNTLTSVTLPHATAGTGVQAYLTGPNAADVAFDNFMGRRLPWVIGVVVVLSMSAAVSRGLSVTARVISAAAAIMVVVFLGFVTTPDVAVKQIGLGLAVAVLVDATLVRLALVPAVMELLGDANWWLPSWLGRILPRAGELASEKESVEVTAF